MSKNIVLAAITGLLSTALAPVKNALVTGTTNPGAAVGTLNTLISSETAAIPSLEEKAISEACTIALEAFGKFEADIAKWVGGAEVKAANDTSAPEKAPDGGSAA